MYHGKQIAGLLLAAFLAAMFAPHAAAQETPESEPGVIYKIPIREMIEPALLYVIRRGVAEAEARDADAIIFVMDTPGGTLDAARDIMHTIQNIEVPTYTFVEQEAFSAGAIIALATDEIYMAPGSVIGDAMPIMMSAFGGVQEMPEAIEEKMVSAVSALIRSAAEQGGHDKKLAESMVRREMEYIIDDEVICAKGQLLTLTDQEAARTVNDDGNIRPLLSSGTVEDIDALLNIIDRTDAEIVEMNVTASEHVARLIAGFAPLFLIVGLIGIYIEVKTPGFGLPGIIGVVALATFLWGHHIAGLAGMEDIVLLMLGFVLLALEIFVIPGFGVAGISGIVLIAWSLIGAMIQHYPGGPWLPSWEQMEMPLIKFALSLGITAVIAAILARYLPKSTAFRRLVLAESTNRDAGYTASAQTEDLVGMVGTALTDLHPAGRARFGDRKLDTVTRGDFIDRGRQIRIVETHGSRIIVEAHEDHTEKETES